MLLVPGVGGWALRRERGDVPPWAAFALVMAPFLIDVTGNTLDLYDTVAWWDDANHFVNWALLSAGTGLLLSRHLTAPRWALVVLVTGIGAGAGDRWELGEWYTFIRHGTELDTAYQDTLGDETLGTLGAPGPGCCCAATTARRRARLTSQSCEPSPPPEASAASRAARAAA